MFNKADNTTHPQQSFSAKETEKWAIQINGKSLIKKKKKKKKKEYQFLAKFNGGILVASLLALATSTEHTNPPELGLLHFMVHNLHWVPFSRFAPLFLVGVLCLGPLDYFKSFAVE